MPADKESYREHWSREAFYGDGFNVIRPNHVPDYLSVNGPHAPHRLTIGEVSLPDRGDPEALPVPVLVGRSGVQLSVSGRERADAAMIDSRIVLINGTRLCNLMIDHGIGVTRATSYEVKRLDSDYFEES